jgi:hypothetical protein
MRQFPVPQQQGACAGRAEAGDDSAGTAGRNVAGPHRPDSIAKQTSHAAQGGVVRLAMPVDIRMEPLYPTGETASEASSMPARANASKLLRPPQCISGDERLKPPLTRYCWRIRRATAQPNRRMNSRQRKRKVSLRTLAVCSRRRATSRTGCSDLSRPLVRSDGFASGVISAPIIVGGQRGTAVHRSAMP